MRRTHQCNERRILLPLPATTLKRRDAFRLFLGLGVFRRIRRRIIDLAVVRDAFAEIIAPLLGRPRAPGSGIADLLWAKGLGQSCVACTRYFYRDGRSRYWRANSQNKCQSHRPLQISGDHLARSFNPSENAGRDHIKTGRRAKRQSGARIVPWQSCSARDYAFRTEISIVPKPAAFTRRKGAEPNPRS